MPTQDKPYWRKRSIAQTNSLACKLTKTQLLTNSSTQRLTNLPISSTQKLINSQTQKFTNSQPHQLKTPSIQKLKLLFLFLQNHSNFHSVLAKKQVKKQVNSHIFYSFSPCDLSIFRHTTCILHHLAILVGRQLAIFPLPITRFLPLKPHFLMPILPLLVLFFMAQKNYIYTIAVDIYAFRLAFSSKTHRIQHHFTLRFAPKRSAFSGILPCVQHQNAVHFAAYCTAFCCK